MSGFINEYCDLRCSQDIRRIACRMALRRLAMTLAIALTLCCGDNRLAAQVTTATVEGVLTDPTGAVIPGTKIVVTNTATKISREAITDGSGRYQVPQLNPGRYSITVSAPGFETLNQNGVTLEVGQELTLPLKLTPGSTTDQITVTDSPPQVNTTSSIVADVVDQKAIENLPLNGRDFSQLPLTTAGVTASRNVSTSTTMGYGVKIVMAGSRPDVTAWLMDGTNIKGITNYGTPADVSGAMLGVGAMQEFQTVVTGFPAEFGQTSGGVINMLTKSGSNAFHGEGLIYARNDLFDAWNYFDQAKQPLSKYQYGGSIGGPIIKDKTFFFVNYEGVVQHHGQTVVSYVPGNDTLNAVTAPELAPYVNVWRTVTPANNDTDTGGTYKEQAGIGQNVQAYNIPILENYFLARVDHQITPKQHIFARFNFDNGKITQPDALPISAVTVEVRTRFSAIQYEKIINDHLISTSRGAYNRTVLHSNTAPTPAALSALFAVPDSLASGPILFQPWGTASPPQIQLPGGATVFSPVSTEQFLRLQNIFEGQESVQWILGPHTIKAGVDFQQIDYNQLASGPGQFGSFTYGTLGNFECDCDSTHQGKAPLSGTQILPFTVDGHEPRQWKQFITAGWVQDDWKLAHNVTLNAGIRYEPFTVPTEKFNRYATLTDWTTATAWAVAPAPVIPARIAGYQANVPLWRGDAMVDLMPRVGFAWDVKGDGKTAVRGGFGIFFVDIMDTYYGTPGQVNAPFYGTIATTAATAGTGTGIYNLATSQNDTALTGPNALSVTLNASTGAKTLIQYDLAPSYEMKYNLSLDRELGKGYSATAELVAGRGVHLWRTFATNYAPATLNNGRPYVASAAGVIDPLTGQGSIHQADAQSFYNAAVFQAKKRFSNGAQVQTSYTYAKNIDDSTSGGVTGVGNEPSTNVPDFAKSDRARSGLFQKHTFLLNGVFPLPYSTKTKWLGYATKGWQLSGVVIANSGEPFTVTASGNLTAPTAAQITAGTTICASVAACPGVTTSIPAKATSLPLNLGSGSTPNGVTANAERPDYAPGRVPSNIKLNPGLKKSQPYFDTSAFVPAAYGFYGNVGRNTLIGPNYANVDASIKRTIPLYGDRYQLQLTADVFNLLNHPNFLIPGTTTATNYAAAYTAPTTAVPIPYQNASAGFLTSTVNNNFSNRQMQFSAKVSF